MLTHKLCRLFYSRGCLCECYVLKMSSGITACDSELLFSIITLARVDVILTRLCTCNNVQLHVPRTFCI